MPKMTNVHCLYFLILSYLYLQSQHSRMIKVVQ